MEKGSRSIILYCDFLFSYETENSGLFEGFKNPDFIHDVITLCKKYDIKWSYTDSIINSITYALNNKFKSKAMIK